MASESPNASHHGDSPSTIRPAVPSTSKQGTQKLGSWLRKPFSRSESRGEEPAPIGIGIAQEQDPQTTSTTGPDTLLVRMQGAHIMEDTMDLAKTVAGYNLAIAAIEIFQTIVEFTDPVLPTPVGKMLEQLTKVLGVLKQMVENRTAWKELRDTLVHHADQFDDQLVRMKQHTTNPDADSGLLVPFKIYSSALEKLTAKIIYESGLVQQDTEGDIGWDKINKFATTCIAADSEKSQIGTYRQELRDAMDILNQNLLMYVAFGGSSAPRGDSRNEIVAKRPPKVSPYYVARGREWNFMVHSIFESTATGQRILAITGMGGCGKTQLVSYFLKEKENLFSCVVYVDASSTASIETDLQTWAQSLGDGHEQDTWERALQLLSKGRWAYILDNADDPALDLPPFIPESSDGTVIITSRNRDVRNLATHYLQVGEMTDEEALSALVKSARRDSPIPAEELESALTLIKELGCLVLAIVQVGTYCYKLSSVVGHERHVFTFTRYLARFKSSRAALMKEAGPPTIDSYKLGVYTTLDLSYEKLPESAKEFLRFISNFHYSDIPVEMLVAAAEKRFCDPKTLIPRPEQHEASISRLAALLGTDRAGSEFQTETVIQTLGSFSLVSTTFIEGQLFLQIHPLVQAWARDKSSHTEAYGIMATQVLTSSFIDININLYRHLLPLILEKLKDNQSSSLHVNDQIAFGQVLRNMGHYSAAEALFRDALKSLHNISGEETENTLWVAEQLGYTSRDQGRYGEAEVLEWEVLEKRRMLLGADHPDTIRVASNLASTYRDQGRYGEAEKLELEVLEKRNKVLGADHLDTIIAAANLASTYRDQGRYEEAERLQLEVLKKHNKILGAEHPDTIRVASNLAYTYREQGRYTEAEKLQLEVLEKSRKILGDGHPDTTTAAGHLAHTYSKKGRHIEAEKLELEVLEKRTKVLGTDHPDTIIAAADLASTYRDQGRYEEAERLQLEVLEKHRKLLGADHPDTVRVASNLAYTYYEQGRYAEAEKLQLEVLEKSRKILGDGHPDTTTATRHLAHTYSKQRRYTEAKKLELEVLEKRNKTLGAEHPHTITTQEVDSSSSHQSDSTKIGENAGSRFVEESVLNSPQPDIPWASNAVGGLGSILRDLQNVQVRNDNSNKTLDDSPIVEYDPRQLGQLANIYDGINKRVLMWYGETGAVARSMNEEASSPSTCSYGVQLVGLNLKLAETSIMVDNNSTFSQIGFLLYAGGTLPVAFEQTCGALPRWRIPNINSQIPCGFTKIYIADITEPFTLALVRDGEEDFPLVLPLSSFSNGTATMGDLVGESLGNRARARLSIRSLSGSREIREMPCDIFRKDIQGLYSTTIFVLLNSDPSTYKFRNDYNYPSLPPLKMAFLQCQNLVDTASHLNTFALLAIHLSRALRHLIICVADVANRSTIEESIEAYYISRMKSLVVKLKSIFTIIEGLTDDTFVIAKTSLLEFFSEICEENPGVVSVRQSFDSFQALLSLDLRDHAISTGRSYTNIEVHRDGDLQQNLALIQDATTGMPSGENDTSGSETSGDKHRNGSEREGYM